MAPDTEIIDTDGMTAPTSTAVIRQWARDNGLPVGERGRLSPELMNAYAEDAGTQPEAPRAKTPMPARVSRRQAGGMVHIPVQPTPGATGIARKIAARSD